MKQKYIWITFLLSILVLVPFRIYQRIVLGQSAGRIFGIGSSDVGILIVFIVFVLLLITMTKFLKDSDVGISLRKSMLAGTFGIISGIMILVSSLIQLMETIPLWNEIKVKISSGSIYGESKEKMEFLKNQVSAQNFTIARCVLGILVCAGLFVFGLSSIKGKNKLDKYRLLSVLPSIWSIAVVLENFTARSSLVLEYVDLFDIISFVSMMLFFYVQAKFFADLNEVTLSRKLFLFGFIAVTSMLTYNIPNVVELFSINDFNAARMTHYLSGILLAVYIVLFLFSVKDHSLIKDGQSLSEKPSESREDEINQDVIDDVGQIASGSACSVDVDMIHVNDMIDKMSEFYT